MKITEISIYPHADGSLLGFAKITFDACFVVDNIRIVNGSERVFCAMPSRVGKDGHRHDVAFPIDQQFRDEIEGQILDAYDARIQSMMTRNCGRRA